MPEEFDLTSSPSFAKPWRSAVAFAALALLVLVGCVPLPIDPSWASVSILNDQQHILFAFSDRVTLIDPVDGSPVELRDSEGNVRVDSSSGNPLLWDVRIQAQPATQFYSAPVPNDEFTLLFPTYSRRIYEVDAQAARINNPEGRLIEDDSTTNHIVTDILATEDTLYIPLSEGDVKAVNRGDWTTRWRFDTDFGVWSPPQLIGDQLIFTSLNHNLYSVDPLTGNPIWALDLSGAVTSAPVLSGDFLYVGSFANRVYKISLEGDIVAEFTTRDWVWGTPAIADDGATLYVGDSSGWVYALDISGDGFNEIWSRDVAERGVRATPLVVEDTLIVASRDRRAYWLTRADGVEIFNREVAGEILANPLLIEPNEAISEPLVIISTMANQEALVAFTIDNGERRWVYSR
jgi:outer membrane protein assembly factor BamB